MAGESILVVEDNGIIALQIAELLEKNGYRIAGTTAFGEEAVAMATKDPPDLICMDIGLMGKIDGIETAREIHEHADIPIIYLTAYSDTNRLARAKETSPYHYLVKPFNERELVFTVDLALHRHAVDRQLRETMQRYQAIVDNAAEGILLVSGDTKTILEANPASARVFGYTGNELTGMNPGDFISWDGIPGGAGAGTSLPRMAGPGKCSSGTGTGPSGMPTLRPASSPAREHRRLPAWWSTILPNGNVPRRQSARRTKNLTFSRG